MKNFIKNALLLGAVCGASASAVEAADCCYPYQPSCCEWSFCDGKFTVGANYLYWQTTQEDFWTIETSQTTSDSQAVISSSSRLHAPQFDYQSGYRVYAVYELPCDQWELGIAYTYVPGKSGWHDFTAVDGLVIDDATFSTFGFKWCSNLNYLDVDIARTLKFGESFRLRPHIGFRAAWGDQNHTAVAAYTVPQTEYNFAHTHYKGKFNAYGVEGGLWGEWNILCNFSLVGHFGGSILYNEINNKRTFEQVLETADAQTTYSEDSIHYKVNGSLPTLDYFIGVRYADSFCDWNFSAYVGWESHVWFHLGHLNLVGSNYTTQGLTAGLDVSF